MNSVKPWWELTHLSICSLSLLGSLNLLLLTLFLLFFQPQSNLTQLLSLSPLLSVGCGKYIFQKFRIGRGESYNQHRPPPPPKILSLAMKSQCSQYLQSSKSSPVECCCCCWGECLASSRQPAGSEGELARGGEQKNGCIIKIIKTMIFTAYAGCTTPAEWEKSLQQNWILLTLYFIPHCIVNGVILDAGVILIFFMHLTLKYFHALSVEVPCYFL